MTDAERTKLSGIAAGANNYTHPDTHPASMIEESTSRKFMTDAEKTLLSSLGTKSAQINAQNLGQNGYRKYEDGLLIQWGYLTNSSAGSATIYFPISFYDASYRFVSTMETVSNEQSVYTALPYKKTTTSVSVMRKFLLADNSITVGSSTRSFDWIAIGKWK